MEKLPISLVIITLNEEDNIERCIHSVPWASDIVVLDSGSTDLTVPLAKELGARTFVEQWRGYRDQKARATELASCDWVLSLDADEALSSDLADEIYSLWQKTSRPDGFEGPRVSFYMNRWIWHGGWYPDLQIRLFDRRVCEWAKGHVHERVIGGNIGKLKCNIEHRPFASLSDQVQTNNEYSGLAARDLKARGKAFSIFMMVVKPVSKFLETYFIKRGFLDGMPGFIISVGASYSMFLKWAKLYELSRLKQSK